MSENIKRRGLKRKRADNEQEDVDTRLAGKLHHGLREVKKAAKVSKTRETQKLVKRLKEARLPQSRNIANTAGELEAELDHMKRINVDQVAATALRTKINKNHSLRNDTRTQSIIASQLSPNCVVPAEPGSPLAKVQARLLSSKAVANAAIAVVQSVLQVIHPELVTPSRTVDDLEKDAEISDRPSRMSKLRTASREIGSDAEDDDEDDAVSVEVDEQHSEQEAHGPLGSDDDSEGASDESGAIHSDAYDDDPDSDEPSSNSGPKISKALAEPKSESMFLPSLSVGFIRGDSDSEFSDGEAASVMGGPKKNRRGQRARRAIWEKKFGKSANHIKKGRGQGSSQANVRGSLKEPFSKNTQKGKGAVDIPQRNRAPGAVPAQSTFHRDIKPRNVGPKEDKPLHPSWEAKRKLKEKQAANIVPAQGTKIKF